MSEGFTLNLTSTGGPSKPSRTKSRKGSFYGKGSYLGRKRALKKQKFHSKSNFTKEKERKSEAPNKSKKIISIEEYSSGGVFKNSSANTNGKKSEFHNNNDSLLKERQHDKFIPTDIIENISNKVKKNTDHEKFTYEKYLERKKTNATNKIKSSLFNSNPVIPDLHQPSIVKVTENTFSKKSFSDFGLHNSLVDYVENKMGFKTATNIQQNTIPILLDGKDTLVKSQTGSGKTLAYALPMIQNLQAISPEVSRSDGPLALVLTPTRELAAQTYEVFQKLTLPFRRIVATWIMGGEKRKSEKARIRKGVNIIVGTPGRILDHINSTECFSLKNIKWLICDEADRLLDMGFEQQIKEIITSLETQKEDTNKKWQSVLLSATLPYKVENLAKVALSDPVHVYASEINATDDDEESFAIPDNLVQHIVVVPSKLRLVSLMLFLKHRLNNFNDKVLVFVSCRDSVVFHFEILKFLCKEGVVKRSENCRIFKLHGGMLQENRQNMFHEFQSATCGVLFCTDVAARGLHLPNVDWVVQYTCPPNPMDYIHRVGRTARAGEKGEALLFVTPTEMKYINLLTQYNIPVNKFSLDAILNDGNEPESGNERQTARENAIQLQNLIEAHIEGTEKLLLQAKLAYGSFIRAYSSYPSNLKSIFHVKHLHLGHVTKSFGLNETPSEVIGSLQKSVKYLQMNNAGKTNKKGTSAKEVIESLQKSYEINSVHKERNQEEDREKVVRRKRPLAGRFNLMSEFGSGLEISKLQKFD